MSLKGWESLYKKGDYIVYDTTGVCLVKDITTIDLNDVPKDKLYYILEPVGTNGGKVITPVENNKSTMRYVLTKEEAYKLINDMKDLEELWVSDSKQREIKYKEALRTCDCREWVRMIKLLYMRREDRLHQGKKMTEMDERYMRKAKENLYGELSIPLGIPISEVEPFILSRIGDSKK